MNPIANRISLLRSLHTIFGGIATGTNVWNAHTHTHTISIRSIHYSCLIVRLNPIIQRLKGWLYVCVCVHLKESEREKDERNEKKKNRNADSITFFVFMK